MLVSDLIDPEKWSWDCTKVRRTVLPHEAEVILGILISVYLPEDSLTWAWTQNGRFMVKSAYRVALKFLKEGNPKVDHKGSSDRSRTTTF